MAQTSVTPDYRGLTTLFYSISYLFGRVSSACCCCCCIPDVPVPDVAQLNSGGAKARTEAF